MPQEKGEKVLKVDFHCHILPGVDHGSGSVEQSLRMLRCARACGVDTILASHHFYGQKQSAEEFIAIRDTAYEKLQAALPQDEQLPRIKKAAEVYLTTELAGLERLEELCIEGTRFILLEMPYEYWSKWVYDAVYHIIAQRRLVPVVAHVERYALSKRDPLEIFHLLEMDVLAQMNASSLGMWTSRGKALELLRRYGIHLLGTDAHDEHHITRDVAKAEKIITHHFGGAMLDYFDGNAADILNGRMPHVRRLGEYI